MIQSVLIAALAWQLIVPNAFGQSRSAVTQPVSSTQAHPNLTGVWQRDVSREAPSFRFQQTGETLKIIGRLEDTDFIVFEGRFISPQLIQGQILTSMPIVETPQMAPKNIYVDDPDHIRIERGAAYVRISTPLPSDAVCDAKNSSHTKANFAYARAVYAAQHNAPQEVEDCWALVSAIEGNSRGQVAAALMYREGDGVPKNPALAFSWAQKSAAQKDPFGEQLLAEMYRKGIGTAPNPELAKYWDDQLAQQRLAAAQAETKKTIDRAIDMAADQFAKENERQWKKSIARDSSECENAGGYWVSVPRGDGYANLEYCQ
jgi:hypothetical protein